MIRAKSIPKKTYKEWMEEKYTKIPIYTEEWTNFNPSDPGITILENLTAFLTLQQDRIDAVPDSVKEKLLELLGISLKRERCASVFIEARGVQKPFLLPANQQFRAGDISFETTFATTVPASRFTGVFGEDMDGIHDYSHILDRDVRLPAYVFGKKPQAKEKLYLVMDAPIPPGEQGTVWVEMDEQLFRNPYEYGFPVSFAKLQWECYTEKGFVPMAVEDGTNGFLSNGQMTFTQPMERAAVYSNGIIRGYVWRGVLETAGYDAAPMVNYMTGFLVPVVQKETLVMTHAFSKPYNIVLECAMLEDSYVRVFAKEKEGESYYLYEERSAKEERGRFYEKERLGYGRYAFRFDKSRYGHAPWNGKDAVKIVLYNEEMMHKYELGILYGYDNQEIRLPKEHVVMDSFLVVAQREVSSRESVYDFFEPGHFGERKLSYELYESEGKLVVRDAGDYIGAKLYLASIAVTLGEEGNVREGNLFTPVGELVGGEVSFFNPARGKGGIFQETLEDARKRFVLDWNTPKTAVTASDYEALVKRTPGLCIAKVHAWMDANQNEVQIVVLPNLRERFAQLPVIYEKAIARWLKGRRLLSTKIRIRQPVYTAVFITGTIYVKPRYNECRKQIEQVIERNVDYISGARQFGETLRFDRIFRAVEALECVAYIDTLGIAPQNTTHAVMNGEDIVPSDDCLLYVGTIKLELLLASENKK